MRQGKNKAIEGDLSIGIIALSRHGVSKLNHINTEKKLCHLQGDIWIWFETVLQMRLP